MNKNIPVTRIRESEKLALPAEVELPPNPAGYTRVATYFAIGVQIYSAQQKAGSNPPEYEWIFVSPCADLYDESNEQVGYHFVGPTWQSGPDRINGQAFSQPRSKNMDHGSIDWLLLMTREGTVPNGIFKGADYIQRLDTTGGKAPSTAPASIAETVGIEYTAIYRFAKKIKS